MVSENLDSDSGIWIPGSEFWLPDLASRVWALGAEQGWGRLSLCPSIHIRPLGCLPSPTPSPNGCRDHTWPPGDTLGSDLGPDDPDTEELGTALAWLDPTLCGKGEGLHLPSFPFPSGLVTDVCQTWRTGPSIFPAPSIWAGGQDAKSLGQMQGGKKAQVMGHCRCEGAPCAWVSHIWQCSVECEPVWCVAMCDWDHVSGRALM